MIRKHPSAANYLPAHDTPIEEYTEDQRRHLDCLIWHFERSDETILEWVTPEVDRYDRGTIFYERLRRLADRLRLAGVEVLADIAPERRLAFVL